jgi:uncharacterized LabA/DUF88 family protein
MKKAIVYIDGYNLYYSLLRRSAYKWLDVVSLFKSLLKAQVPGAELVAVKYFTAPALAKFATRGHDSVSAQNEYHRALLAKHGNMIHIINGYHTASLANLMTHQNPPQTEQRQKVWLIEEKQTDVNIALTVYRDVAKGEANLIVVCSNDSDLIPAINALREDFDFCEIGLIAPLPEPSKDQHRRANAELKKLAHWTRHYLRYEELKAAQLPEIVPTNKKAARKPAHWY